jgi:hypothetical protein
MSIQLRTLLNKMAHEWRVAGLAASASSVTQRDLDDAQRRLGVRVPDDVATYFQTVNGMLPDVYDRHDLRFWALDELQPVGVILKGIGGSSYKDYVVFADYSLFAHAYAILPGPKEVEQVALVGGQQPIRIASSFMDFIDNYVNNTELLFPK